MSVFTIQVFVRRSRSVFVVFYSFFEINTDVYKLFSKMNVDSLGLEFLVPLVFPGVWFIYVGMEPMAMQD